MLVGTAQTICPACGAAVPVISGLCVICGVPFPVATLERDFVRLELLEAA